MNSRLRELMLQAGYAAPELATRAQVLAKLVVEDLQHSNTLQQLLAAEGHFTDKGYSLGNQKDYEKQVIKRNDPCRTCKPGHVCRTPACGRLKLPLDHPLRTVSYWND